MQKSTLSSKAYEHIKLKIISGEAPPGGLISENSLARELGMSRTPIREALKALSNEELINIRNGVGIFIKNLSNKDIIDIYEVRSSLEILALKTSINLINNEDIIELERNWYLLKEKILNNEKVAYAEISFYDSLFHSLIIDNSENNYLKDLIENIKTKIKILLNISATSHGDPLSSVNQHINLIVCLKERDFEKTSFYLKKHLENSAKYIVYGRSQVDNIKL